MILRHDIDTDIEKALKLAEIENTEGVSSTYFILLTSDFYNVFSGKNGQMIKRLSDLGHEIGLHFDEVRYPGITLDELAGQIKREADILSLAADKEVKSVSMHRPSKKVLEADLVIPGMVNSYSQVFFRQFKYLSDSRRHWREPVEEIICSEQYEKLHILTHAFWYNEVEKNINESIKMYVNHANKDRYLLVKENITDIASIMGEEEIVYE